MAIATRTGTDIADIATVNVTALAEIETIDGVDLGLSSYLLEENFETVGTGPGWTDTGTVGWGDTTPPAPLVGVRSIRVTGAANFTVKLFTSNGHIWAFFTFVLTNMTNSVQLLRFLDSGNNVIAAYGVGSDGGVRAINNGSQNETAGGVVVLNTQYYGWFEYNKGTGTNSRSASYISTTTTKPALPNITVTNGTATTNAEKIRLGTNANTSTAIMDKLRVSDTDIGSNPP